jgi:translation initiation factor 3 subunit B
MIPLAILILPRYQVQYDDGFDNMLVVDGIPVIDKSKLEKLFARICKEFSRKGVPIKPDDIFMPWNDAGKSQGYTIVRHLYFRASHFLLDTSL